MTPCPVLVVKLQPDLEPMVRTLVFHALMQVHGVQSVTDLSVIGMDTLKVIMREPIIEPGRKTTTSRKQKRAAA